VGPVIGGVLPPLWHWDRSEEGLGGARWRAQGDSVVQNN
jgi:hypothetical protein